MKYLVMFLAMTMANTQGTEPIYLEKDMS